MLKELIKNIFKLLGYKLNKINRRLPTSFVNAKPSIEEIKCIINSNGILHLGAHRGKEAEIYSWFNKKVLWVEANPKIFNDLKNHVKYYFKQRAINSLLGENNKKSEFYISNRDASCSSIFDLSDEVKSGKLWKNEKIKMVDKINLNMVTLDNLLSEESISAREYDHWVLDLQGSEYQVLKGSVKSLKFCKSLMVEISKQKFYEGDSSDWSDILNFLKDQGFQPINHPTSDHCDVLFQKSL